MRKSMSHPLWYLKKRAVAQIQVPSINTTASFQRSSRDRNSSRHSPHRDETLRSRLFSDERVKVKVNSTRAFSATAPSIHWITSLYKHKCDYSAKGVKLRRGAMRTAGRPHRFQALHMILALRAKWRTPLILGGERSPVWWWQRINPVNCRSEFMQRQNWAAETRRRFSQCGVFLCNFQSVCTFIIRVWQQINAEVITFISIKPSSY